VISKVSASVYFVPESQIIEVPFPVIVTGQGVTGTNVSLLLRGELHNCHFYVP
jgi:hypothetical protein